MKVNDLRTKSVEVLVMIHFIMYPCNPLFNSRIGQADIEKLRDYLQENSDFISQHTELLGYFALPYIQNPVDHPNFCHLFTTSWLDSLKGKVLSCTSSETSETLLESLVFDKFHKKNLVFQSEPSSVLPSIYIPDMTFAPKGSKFQSCSLNFTKICYDLNTLSDETQICALLQALRWKITKNNSENPTIWIDIYVKNNLFSVVKPHDSLLDRLLNSNKKIEEYTLRLLNVVAYKQNGREYLLGKEGLIGLILKILFAEKNKSGLRQICLCLLQKLSLSKIGQVCMLQLDMAKWIFRVIKKEIPNVDEEMIEFCTGILMNLSVRSAAKAKFLELQPELLQVLTKYLVFRNSSVVKYICCLLYTLLSYESIRASAKSQHLERQLKTISNASDSEVSKELDLIIAQLANTEDNNTSLISDIDPDESYTIIDDDMEDLITDPNVLKGFELLRCKYENKLENPETISENGFEARDKIPRTPFT